MTGSRIWAVAPAGVGVWRGLLRQARAVEWWRGRRLDRWRGLLRGCLGLGRDRRSSVTTSIRFSLVAAGDSDVQAPPSGRCGDEFRRRSSPCRTGCHVRSLRTRAGHVDARSRLAISTVPLPRCDDTVSAPSSCTPVTVHSSRLRTGSPAGRHETAIVAARHHDITDIGVFSDHRSQMPPCRRSVQSRCVLPGRLR